MRVTFFFLFLFFHVSSFAIIAPRLAAEDCSKITLQSGEVIEAVISTINETEIYYRPCNFSNGERIVLEKSKIWNIKSPTGNIVFKNPKVMTKEEMKVANTPPKMNTMSMISFGLILMAILALLLSSLFNIDATLALWLPILAIPFSIIALAQIKKSPKKYSILSKIFAWISLVLGIAWAVFLTWAILSWL